MSCNATPLVLVTAGRVGEWTVRVRVAMIPLTLLCITSLAACDSTSLAVPGEVAVDVVTPAGTQTAWCVGQGPGVVLVNGIGDDATSAQWVKVQSALADHARVCRYDRLGTGRSDSPNTAGRAADHLDEELDAVVDLAAKDAPVIVVAHSFGGYLSRVYADRHPDRVRALVFVDALDPSVGVPAGTGASTTADVEMADEQLDLKGLEGAVQSVVHLAEDPVVIVLSRGEGATTAWTEGQQRLAALSSRSTLVVVPQVGHQIPSEDPVAVVTAVDDAIRATR